MEILRARRTRKRVSQRFKAWGSRGEGIGTRAGQVIKVREGGHSRGGGRGGVKKDREFKIRGSIKRGQVYLSSIGEAWTSGREETLRKKRKPVGRGMAVGQTHRGRDTGAKKRRGALSCPGGKKKTSRVPVRRQQRKGNKEGRRTAPG